MSLYAGGGVRPKGAPFEPQDSRLVVEPDATSIYEEGKLRPVRIAELIGNEVAIRQVLNDLNTTKKELERVRGTVIPPGDAALHAVFGVLGLVVLAIGVNQVTQPPRTPDEIAVLVAGVLLSLAGACAPAWTAWRRKTKSPRQHQ